MFYVIYIHISNINFLHTLHRWRKNTNFELGTRVPLIISVPDLSKSRLGARDSKNFVELVDLMPTIADLAGIDVQSIVKNETKLAGVSLKEFIYKDDPVITKNASFSQYPRAPRNMKIPYAHNGIDHKNRSKFKVMGYSVRTADWRYTEWRLWNNKTLSGKWDVTPIGIELYDHRNEVSFPTNFDVGENDNIISKYKNSKVVEELANLLKEMFDP